jgi:hypothetical protein
VETAKEDYRELIEAHADYLNLQEENKNQQRSAKRAA